MEEFDLHVWEQVGAPPEHLVELEAVTMTVILVEILGVKV